jgi:hypothetical protein
LAIKRMDVNRGKFYIDGPLREGFELEGKENIVKVNLRAQRG